MYLNNDKKLIMLYKILGTLIQRQYSNKVSALDPLEFALYIGDPNIAPGGYKTIEEISKILENIGFKNDRRNKILDIGSNSGHSTFLLKNFIQGKVVGIDIRRDLVKLSNIISDKLNYDVSFKQMDVRNMTFDNNCFSLVVSSGSLAFIEENLDSAISEMYRVADKGAYLVDTCISYKKIPPFYIVEEASRYLGNSIPVLTLGNYIDIYTKNGFQLIKTVKIKEEHRMKDEEIIKYVLRRENYLRGGEINDETNTIIKGRLKKILSSYSKNNRYTRSDILVFKKE